MSATHTQPAAAIAAKTRPLAVGALFAFVQLLTMILRLRSNPRAWLLFRLLLGTAGAALVVVPLGTRNNWVLAVLGLATFLTAALLSAAPPRTAADDKARELHAPEVLRGGAYLPPNGNPVPVQFFPSRDYIWVLDGALRTLLVIPVVEIRLLRVSQVSEAGKDRWRLRIEGFEDIADFIYAGFFAEQFARAAQSTIQRLLPATLPVLQARPKEQPEEVPRRRAASA